MKSEGYTEWKRDRRKRWWTWLSQVDCEAPSAVSCRRHHVNADLEVTCREGTSDTMGVEKLSHEEQLEKSYETLTCTTFTPKHALQEISQWGSSKEGYIVIMVKRTRRGQHQRGHRTSSEKRGQPFKHHEAFGRSRTKQAIAQRYFFFH